MLGPKLRAGERIDVEYAGQDGRLYTFISRIEAITSARLTLTHPDPGGTLPFERTERVVIRMSDETHTLSGYATFLGPTGEASLRFTAPEHLERFPKRRYFRVAVDLPLVIHLGRGQRVVARVVDLSGSGLFAYVKGDFDVLPGELVEARLDLPDSPRLVLLKVVRNHTLADQGVSVAFDFYDLRPRDQDTIIAYILKRHRETVQVVRGRRD